MNSQDLHTAWCFFPGEAGEEIWNWSLLGVNRYRPTGDGCIRTEAKVLMNAKICCSLHLQHNLLLILFFRPPADNTKPQPTPEDADQE